MNNSSISFGHPEDSIIVPYTLKAVFSVALVVVVVVSEIGNVLVIVNFFKTQSLRTSTNYYITSMAASDLLLVTTNWPLYLSERLSVFGQTTLSDFACQVGTYLSLVSYAVSIESLVLISVDRFIATVFPMNATIITRRIRTIFILLTWFLPMGLLVTILYFTRTADEHEGPNVCYTEMSTDVHTLYLAGGFVLCYCAPLVVIITLSSCIMQSLRRTNPMIQGNGLSNIRRRKQNVQIMKVLTLINVLFFICWTPSYVTGFLLTFPQQIPRNTQAVLYILSQYFLPFVSSAVNPVILFTFSTNYRQALKNSLRLAVVKCRSCFVQEQAVHEQHVELPELR